MRVIFLALVLCFVAGSGFAAEEVSSILDKFDLTDAPAAPKNDEPAAAPVNPPAVAVNEEKPAPAGFAPAAPCAVIKKQGEAAAKRDAAREKFNNMARYQSAIDQRAKEIEMLSLDLKKADLECKVEESRSKLKNTRQDTEKPASSHVRVIAGGDNAAALAAVPMDVRLILVTIIDQDKTAVFQTGNTNYRVKKGDNIFGYAVDGIETNKVVLAGGAGEIVEIARD